MHKNHNYIHTNNKLLLTNWILGIPFGRRHCRLGKNDTQIMHCSKYACTYIMYMYVHVLSVLVCM